MRSSVGKGIILFVEFLLFFVEFVFGKIYIEG